MLKKTQNLKKKIKNFSKKNEKKNQNFQKKILTLTPKHTPPYLITPTTLEKRKNQKIREQSRIILKKEDKFTKMQNFKFFLHLTHPKIRLSRKFKILVTYIFL